VTAGNVASHTLVAGVPYAGGPIVELMDGLAQGRTQQRLHAVFSVMKDRLEALREEKVDREFFNSEEFQTLLFLMVIEKLQTTQDTQKLESFGGALANSGRASMRSCFDTNRPSGVLHPFFNKLLGLADRF
jgi:hypothetical protein